MPEPQPSAKLPQLATHLPAPLSFITLHRPMVLVFSALQLCHGGVRYYTVRYTIVEANVI